jgi:site-specific DNA-methyltransferase (adenine-specific)
MNPPYKDAYPWSRKGVEYAEAGGTVIALLPAWTDSKFFHNYCSLGRITFIRNRLEFGGGSSGGAAGHAPFPSIIVEWLPDTIKAARERRKKGDDTIDGKIDTVGPDQRVFRNRARSVRGD